MKKIRLIPTSWQEHRLVYNTIPTSVNVRLAYYFPMVISLSVEDLFRLKATLWNGQNICGHQYPKFCYEMYNSAIVISFFNSHVITVEITNIVES